MSLSSFACPFQNVLFQILYSKKKFKEIKNYIFTIDLSSFFLNKNQIKNSIFYLNFLINHNFKNVEFVQNFVLSSNIIFLFLKKLFKTKKKGFKD